MTGTTVARRRRVRSRRSAVAVAAVVVMIALTACGGDDLRPADDGAQTSDDVGASVVDTPALRTLKADAGIEECPRTSRRRAVEGGLPGVVLDCLGGGAPVSLPGLPARPTVLNVWATWCGPCRQETPELVKLHKEFRSQGLEVVGLSTENPDDSADKVREFVHNYNVDYRVGWSGPQVAVALMQGRDAIPQSFVISRDGRVLKRFIGFNAITTPEQIRAAVQDALSNKAAAD